MSQQDNLFEYLQKERGIDKECLERLEKERVSICLLHVYKYTKGVHILPKIWDFDLITSKNHLALQQPSSLPIAPKRSPQNILPKYH